MLGAGAASSIFVLAAIFAPVIAPVRAARGHARRPPRSRPAREHIMGTDLQGRDEYTRILYGAQVSLVVAVGVRDHGAHHRRPARRARRRHRRQGRHRPDARSSTCCSAIPGILLAIGIVAWLGRGLPQIMLAVAMTNAPIFARILRGSLLALRESDYVIAARSLGRRAAPDAAPAHAAQLADAADRRGDPRPGDGDHRRRRPRLPRPRPARPADAGVGDDAHRLRRSSCARPRGCCSSRGSRS